MTFVRRILTALVAATFVWAGAAAAQSAHAHDLSGKHLDAIHAVALDVDADHHVATNAHGHDHHDAHQAPSDDGTAPSEHESGIFHVHALCFVALAAEIGTFQHDVPEQAIAPAELIVSLHTRSIGPADRPPRTFL